MMDKKRVILINAAVIAAVLLLAIGAMVLSELLPKTIQPTAGVLEGFEPIVTTDAPAGE